MNLCSVSRTKATHLFSVVMVKNMSYPMVNLAFIDKYDKSGVIHLKNGKKIPVSSRKKEQFVKAFLNRNLD